MLEKVTLFAPKKPMILLQNFHLQKRDLKKLALENAMMDSKEISSFGNSSKGMLALRGGGHLQ